MLEVETPLLGAGPAPDAYVENFEVQTEVRGDQRTLYLQTSPELAMKRLLAAGSGPIYQICKAFRAGETSAIHNPEFTLLEWYRPGWTHLELMSEVAELIETLCTSFDRRLGAKRKITYRDLFREQLDVDPFVASNAQLTNLLSPSRQSTSGLDRNDVLGLLLTDHIEPQLDRDELLLVYDYPAAQAALAKTANDPGGRPVAERFEAYFGGLELANGYNELTDAAEQRRRLMLAEHDRAKAGLSARPLDERFVAALDAGLPPCAGVALGLDRLLLTLLGKTELEGVLAFPIDRA